MSESIEYGGIGECSPRVHPEMQPTTCDRISHPLILRHVCSTFAPGVHRKVVLL